MSSETQSPIPRIVWREWFPWTLIFRSLQAAANGSIVLLAFVALLLTSLGWRVSELVFVRDALRERDPGVVAFSSTVTHPFQSMFHSASLANASDLTPRLMAPIDVFGRISQPFWRLFSDFGGLAKFLYLGIGCLLTLAVWAFFGTAIARIAVMRYTRNESVSLGDAVQFARNQFLSALSSIGIPLIGVAILCVPAAIAGLLMSFNIGLFIVSIFFILIQLLALIITLMLLGLAFGWPLAISAIGTEGQGAYDALTRAFSYVFQRPLNYVFYGAVATLFGGLCWVVIAGVTDGVIHMSYWSTSFGANVSNPNRVLEVQAAAQPLGSASLLSGDSANQAPWAFRSATAILGFWTSAVLALAVSFLFGQFWCLAAAVYLLLRKDVDDAELDEVFVEDEQRSFELPQLDTEEPPAEEPPEPANDPAPESAADGDPADGNES